MKKTIASVFILFFACIWAIDFLNYKNWTLFIVGIIILIFCITLIIIILKHFFNQSKKDKHE